MKIYGNKPPENQDIYLNAQKVDKQGGASEKGIADEAVKKDRVDLSVRAKEIARLKEAVNQIPDIRMEKVQALEKAITEGAYKIDSLKISGKLINELV